MDKKIANLRSEYPNGTLWQDDSSKGEDGLVDFYIMRDVWEFFKRDFPIYFYNPLVEKKE